MASKGRSITMEQNEGRESVGSGQRLDWVNREPKCNVPVSQKKKELEIRYFQATCVPPITPLPTTHFNLSHPLMYGAISLICFFFFSFHLNTLLSITLILSTGTSIPHPPFPPSFFRQDHWKILKNLETPSHPFFKVKISNLFGRFYTFA